MNHKISVIQDPMQLNLLLVYAFNAKQSKVFVGYYDGYKFHNEKHSIDQIKKYDFIKVCKPDGSLIRQTPKRFIKNLIKELELDYVRTFGEQTSLFWGVQYAEKNDESFRNNTHSYSYLGSRKSEY